jgi:hypothetical protein
MATVLLGYASANPTYNFNLDDALVEDGLNIPTIASEDWGSGYKV